MTYALDVLALPLSERMLPGCISLAVGQELTDGGREQNFRVVDGKFADTKKHHAKGCLWTGGMT